ncbi:MAG: hypothetical protein J07HQX50_01637 [Haloquadratum sp. J07HQX50]|nr:MAG: hypothetical protein J07HQX50_01637 [Haloquadratum sp. J07HQX50]
MNQIPKHIEHVVYLDSGSAKARGVIGRYPERDTAYVFRCDSAAYRLIHMIGVSKPLTVQCYRENRLHKEVTLRPYVGLTVAK